MGDFDGTNEMYELEPGEKIDSPSKAIKRFRQSQQYPEDDLSLTKKSQSKKFDGSGSFEEFDDRQRSRKKDKRSRRAYLSPKAERQQRQKEL